MKSNIILKTISISLFCFLFINTLSYAQNDPSADSWEDSGTTTFTNNNVGIGTPSLGQATLSLLGPEYDPATQQYPSGGLMIEHAVGSGSNIRGGRIGFHSNYGNWGVSLISRHLGSERYSLEFVTKDGFWTDHSESTKMVLSPDGRLGIGVENPQHKLDVDGFVRCEELLIEDVVVPDFVFTKNYDLPTIDEEAAYIKKHGHLIGYESAIAMGGKIRLSDYTTRNHEKIEVLILHAIELNEENKMLKNKVVSLESEMAEMKKMLESLLQK